MKYHIKIILEDIFLKKFREILDDNDIANNMFAGQRVGSNAVENNLTSVVMNKDRTKGVVVDAKKDGNTDIVDQDGNPIINTKTGNPFKTYEDGEFALENCFLGKCTINFGLSLDLDKIGDTAIDRGVLLLTWDSKTNGFFDLKNTLLKEGFINSHSDGLTTTQFPDIIMNARTLGNYSLGYTYSAVGIPYSLVYFGSQTYSIIDTGGLEYKMPIIKDGYYYHYNNNKKTFLESFTEFLLKK